jgi:hypothetical protein
MLEDLVENYVVVAVSLEATQVLDVDLGRVRGDGVVDIAEQFLDEPVTAAELDDARSIPSSRCDVLIDEVDVTEVESATGVLLIKHGLRELVRTQWLRRQRDSLSKNED